MANGFFPSTMAGGPITSDVRDAMARVLMRQGHGVSFLGGSPGAQPPMTRAPSFAAMGFRPDVVAALQDIESSKTATPNLPPLPISRPAGPAAPAPAPRPAVISNPADARQQYKYILRAQGGAR